MRSFKRSIRNHKSKGFTLTELIAVMAIIAILATAMAPKIVGYIEEGKKTNALEEARQVVMAVDSYNISKGKSEAVIATSDEYSSFVNVIAGKDYIDKNDVEYISDDNTYEQLVSIVKGDKSFTLVNGKIKTA